MKKKLLCVGLALALILSFTACDKDKGGSDGGGDAMAAFEKVQKNMEDIKDAQYKMDMNMSSGDTQGSTLTMSADTKQVVKSDDDVELAMDMTMDMAGNAMSGKVYVKDKNMYMDMYGQKMKVSTDDETAALMSANTDELLDISEDMIKNLKMAKEGDDTVFTFSIAADKAMEYFQENAGSSQDVVEAMGDVSFKKMDMKIVAGKDDMVKSMDMDCSMEAKNDDSSTTVNYTLSVVFKSINSGLTIDFPDFKDYKDASV